MKAEWVRGTQHHPMVVIGKGLDSSEALQGLREGELLPEGASNKSPAPNISPNLHSPQVRQKDHPGWHERFGFKESLEKDPVAAQKRSDKAIEVRFWR